MRSNTWVNGIGAAAFLVIAAALYFALIFAPTEFQMGSIQRIFYFHMGADVVGLSAIVVAGIASIGYLRTNRARWDHVAYAAMELGLVFGTIALATGMIWARPTWGTWWTWDPRLTTFLILWLIYVGYLMLRASAREDPHMARLGAVLAIVGIADVPFVIIAPRIWKAIHPVIFGGTNDSQLTFNMEPTMVPALILGIIGMLLLFTYLLIQRVRLEELSATVESLKLMRQEHS